MSQKLGRRFISLLCVGVLIASPAAHSAPRLIRVAPNGSSTDAVPTLTKGNPKPRTSTLPPLDLSDMAPWNYAGKWVGSEWANNLSPLPWKYDHIVRQADGAVSFRLDSQGAPQLKAGDGTPWSSRGMWEVYVTLPQLREGLVVAPLWLFNQGAGEEIDFEFAGTRGLDVSVHAYQGGVHNQKTVRLFAGQNWSGRTVRLGIKADIPAGWAEMYVDGMLVQRFTKAELGFFPAQPTRPVIEMWAADPNNSGFVGWVGKWTPLASTLTMTVRGYNYTAI